MDGGVWWATVHGVSKSRTRLSDSTFTFFSLSVYMCQSQSLSLSLSISPLGFLGSTLVKNPPTTAGAQDTQVRSLDQEDPLEKEMATCSSIPPWKIPWTEEPGCL